MPEPRLEEREWQTRKRCIGLFAHQAGEVMRILTEDCMLHTVLRLPRGTLTPYSAGVKANVIFFTKGYPTEHVWIYDARTHVPSVTKKDRQLTPALPEPEELATDAIAEMESAPEELNAVQLRLEAEPAG